jgi:hypothetical protein
VSQPHRTASPTPASASQMRPKMALSRRVNGTATPSSIPQRLAKPLQADRDHRRF